MSTPMLNGASVTPSLSKSLPLVSKEDDLPIPPPSTQPRNDLPPTPPPPPPKIITAEPGMDDLPSAHSISAARSVPPSPSYGALSIPDINTPPESPGFASSSHSPGSQTLSTLDARPKKPNPFVDLLETEKTYVDTLSGIIRKVASAWSRANLPPSQLDAMFRCIEAIFKANRFLLAKLKEIGLNPSSPRAIGDLLMKWIDHLETPYTNYCQQYMTGFDTWEPVQSNPRLPSVLESFSSSNPPTAGSKFWTLDALFILPRLRIKYYQKLYTRLLKNSGKGKATDKMLVNAVEKLDNLVSLLEERHDIALPSGIPTPPAVEMTDEIVIDTRSAAPADDPEARNSVASSTRESSYSGQRSSRETAATSEGGSPTIPTMSIQELEKRLSTNRCTDLFTMQPRNVRLSINSANLPYSRELRVSQDALVYFTPNSTSKEVVHQQGHIFLLTDLFLVCEWILPNDRTGLETEQVDMWLCYPPLAAKHLRVSAIDGSSFEITILKKEVMTIRLNSLEKRDLMIREFQAVIDAAMSLPPPSKQPPPPVPLMPGMPLSPAGPLSAVGSTPSIHSASFGENRVKATTGSPGDMSPVSAGSHPPQRTFSIESGHSASASSSRSASLADHGSDPPPYSPERTLSPGFNDETRSMSQPNIPSFGSRQTIPPQRSDSARSEPANLDLHIATPGLGPAIGHNFNGQIIPPPRGQSVMSPSPLITAGTPFPPRSNSVQQQSQVGYGPPNHTGHGGQYLNGPPIHTHNSAPQGLNDYPPNRVVSMSGSVRSPAQPHQHNLLSPSPQMAPMIPPPGPAFPNNLQNFHQPGHVRPMLQSNAYRPGIISVAPTFVDTETSPPESPVEDAPPAGPAESAVTATVKCKVFLKQQHAQWKSLGSAKLTLYEQASKRDKQIVVQSENKDKTMLISTMVLTDGVERVGKTGVAIEISDKGARTGIIYMLQLRNEKAAGNLFDLLIAGSDRSGFTH